MSYLPYATSANAAGTTGQPNAVILKLAATTTLTRNRFITLSSGDEDASIVCVGGVLAAPLSAISAATGAHTIANGNNTGQVWNWANTTDSTNAFALGETTAATNGTNTNGVPNQVLLKVSTLSPSTMYPFAVYARGLFALGVATNGQIYGTTGSEGSPSYSFASISSNTGNSSGMFLPGASRLGFSALGKMGYQIFNDVTNNLFHLWNSTGNTVVASSTTGAFAFFSSSNDGSLNALNYFNNHASTSSFIQTFRKSRGTTASPSVITTGDDLGSISAYGYVGATNTYLPAAQILFDSTGTIADTTSGIGGQIKFYTTLAGTDTSVQLAMTISGGSASLVTLVGDLQLGNAYVATPQVGTGYVTLKDSTGTTYKVLVAT